MSDSETGLYKKFAGVLWMMHSYTRRNLWGFLSGMNPHQGQGRVLALLKLQPEISQKELAFLLGMRPQSLGELLAKLELRGYIARSPSAEDRRVILIRLTEAGRTAAQRQEEASDDARGLFDCLSADEQDALESYLDKIMVSLKRRGSAGEDGARFTQSEPGEDAPKSGRGYINFDWAGGRDGWQPGLRRGLDNRQEKE